MNIEPRIAIILTLLATTWLPGVATLRYLGLWRRMSVVDRHLLALPTSLLIMPALLYFLGHLYPLTQIMALACGLSYSIFLFLLSRRCQASNDSSVIPATLSKKGNIAFFLLLFLLFLAVVLKMLELEDPIRLFPAVGDYPKHDGIIQALTGGLLPPNNPFFRPDHDIRLSYYYLFHILPAVLGSGGGTLIANNFTIIAFLVASAFLFIMMRWSLLFSGKRIHPLVVATLFVCIGGFDLIQIIRVSRSAINECNASLWSCYWDSVPLFSTAWEGTGAKISDFVHSVAWVPQHMLSTLGLLCIPLLYIYVPQKKRLLPFLPLMVLTSIGSSIYVGFFGLAHFFVFTAIVLARRKERRTEILTWPNVATAFATGLVLLLFAWEIRPSPNTTTATFVLTWPPLLGLLVGLGPLLFLFSLAQARQTWKLALPWIQSLFMGSIILGCFVRSTGHYNDFGVHTLFIARTLLTIFASFSVYLLLSNKAFLRMAIAIPVVLISFFSILHEVYGLGPYRIGNQLHFEKKNIDFLEVADHIKRETPKNAIVQSPVRKLNYLLLLSQRRSVILDHFHGSLLNVDEKLFNQASKAVANIFGHLDDPKGAIVASKLGIDYLLLRNRHIDYSKLYPYKSVFRNDSYSLLQVPGR